LLAEADRHMYEMKGQRKRPVLAPVPVDDHPELVH
jgi:hypothetical protein